MRFMNPSPGRPRQKEQNVGQRQTEEEGVESVEDASMTGQQGARVLDPGLALEQGLG